MNKKFNLFLIAFLLITLSNTTTIWGQGVGINSTNSTPDASAMLDVKSSDKGVLIPRMTTVQRTAIASPATGLLVFDNTSTSFWFYNGVAWTELGGERLFTKTGTTIQPNTTIINETTDDFVFGAIHLEDDGDANHDNRLFFDKSKGAFRAGTVTDTEWDDVNVGINSTAFGKNNVSSGDYSAAFGRETTSSGLHSISSGLLTRAIGTYSTTKGYNTEASGSYSSAAGNYTEASADGANAWGTNTEASGVLSTAWGRYTDATGSSSTAWGTHTDATGTYATAWGRSTDATGTGATAWGDNSVATRDYSTAWGVYASAYGTYSTAWGGYTEAFSAYETTLGAYNTSYTATSTTGWDASDRLFTLGNGTSATAKHNALTIYKDGTMNINDAYNMPTADGLANQVMTTDGAGVATWMTLSTGTDDQNLTGATLTGNNLQIDIEGGSSVTADLSSLQIFTKTGNLIHPGSTVDETADDFVFGATQIDDDGNSNHDNRLFFDKSKGAFRAGQVVGNSWNVSNLGNYSAAFGRNTTASGNYSLAAGQYASAGGTQSAAWGYACSAAGSNSTAFGYYTEATATYSTAWGYYTDATGQQSTAWGNSTDARSAYETAMGSYNTDYTPNSTSSWDADDRLFSIGNGTSYSNRSNALSIYKDGTMNINDAYDMPTTDGTTGQVITTNGAGVSTWSTLIGGAFEVTAGVVNPNSTVDETADDFVFGATQLDDDGNAAHDDRLYFDKSKGAFRAGEVTSTQWDDANVGIHSTALGYNTTASGAKSTALGYLNTASGTNSMAFGNSSNASGTNSTAWGYSTDATASGATSFGLWSLASSSYATAWGNSSEASGGYSTAFGNSTTSSGSYSTAFGINTTSSGSYSTAFGNSTTSSGSYSTTWGNNTSAPSGYETTIGQYNTTYTPTATTSWDANDRLFTIGNGTSNTARADAFTVLKNGFVGIGVSTPASDLHIKCTSTAEAGSGGITLETTNNTNNWRVYHSGLYCSFAENGVRRAYVQNGTGTWIVVSDGNRKKNINNLENVLGKVNQLRPVTYHYKDQKDSDQKVTGFVAQEVEKIFPDMVSYDEDGNIGMGYAQFGILSIAAVKEQQQLIDKQQSEIDQLKNEIQEIKKLLK